MTTRRISLGKFSFRTIVLFPLHLLMASVLLLSSSAQEPQNEPANTPDPAPAATVFQNSIAREQLAFLNDYAGRPAKDAMKDKRFGKLLKLAIPRSEYHYGRDMPLSDASDLALSGSMEPVEIREGRYVTISGARGPYLSGRGFLWFDMQAGIGLGGFFFHPTNGEPTPTLAIFSRQLKQDSLGLSELPLAFAEDLSSWSGRVGLPMVTVRYFIPESGKKYVLVHDEDFCDHPPNAPAPAEDDCLQMNADAADADVNAAYFMARTHNAANATAWMLGADQVAWISFRDQSCGVGAGRLPCRIRVTRQRTRVLLH